MARPGGCVIPEATSIVAIRSGTSMEVKPPSDLPEQRRGPARLPASGLPMCPVEPEFSRPRGSMKLIRSQRPLRFHTPGKERSERGRSAGGN